MKNEVSYSLDQIRLHTAETTIIHHTHVIVKLTFKNRDSFFTPRVEVRCACNFPPMNRIHKEDMVWFVSAKLAFCIISSI